MKKIGIIGLGLIGGSIFKSLKSLGYDVVAVSRSMKGILPEISDDYEILKDCSVVFVCCAMNKALETLDCLEKILDKETIVTDVCSLKSFVCQKSRSYKFIPSHPMAGTENRGFENSFEGLFKDAKWVITPCFEVDSDAKNILINLITEMGAEIVETTPAEHDKAVALISHMPMVVAQALFLTADTNQLALNISSSGFRDMTRLALSNEEMASDMVNMNSDNIQNAILQLYNSMGCLMKDYESKISQIKSKRSKMFQKT